MSRFSSIADTLRQQLADRLVRRALIVAGVAGAAMFLALVYYYQHSTGAGQSLNANYGRRSGSGAESVNGTSVLSQMFELEGYRVRTADRLSPRLRKSADVIVWTPDSFLPPTKKQREYLERWLAGGRERTLVYIGRDYSAAADYWTEVQKTASPQDAKIMAGLANAARQAHDLDRSHMPDQEYARWFTVRREGSEVKTGESSKVKVQSSKSPSPPLPRAHRVAQLSGPWAEGVVAAKADIRLAGQLDVPAEKDAGEDDEEPPDEVETLLEGDGEPLAFRLHDFAWDEGEVIVVTNGSFLLNYPLINREHRRLASRLIDECSGREVVFLESGVLGPEIVETDARASSRWSNLWPLNAITFHLTVFGIVLCLTYWPIFGRPRTPGAENPSGDFGRHVSSLGDLLARTKNISYAQSRLAQYQQQARRGSGASHRK